MPHPSRLVEVSCATCGKIKKIPLSQFQRSKNGRFFCNGQCRGAYKTNLVITNCGYCGKEIIVPKYRFDKFENVFCDRTCTGLAARQRVIVQCAYCNKDIELRPSEKALYDNHFCDAKCHANWRSENVRGEDHPRWSGGKSHKLNCGWCGKEVFVNKHRIGLYGEIFCSKECHSQFRKAYYIGENNPNWKGGVWVKCANCGEKDVYVKPSHKREFNFCSRECMHEFRVGEKHHAWTGGPVKVNCEVCGKEFEVSKGEIARGGGKHCSLECSSSSKKNGETFNCAFCGKETYRSQSQIVEGRLSFCDMDCKNQYFVGPNAPSWNGGSSFEPYPYEFHLAKPKVKRRDNFSCRLCGANGDDVILHIHHIDYDKQNNELDNLITLCNGCHLKTNTNRESWLFYFQRLQ